MEYRPFLFLHAECRKKTPEEVGIFKRPFSLGPCKRAPPFTLQKTWRVGAREGCRRGPARPKPVRREAMHPGWLDCTPNDIPIPEHGERSTTSGRGVVVWKVDRFDL